MILEAWYIIKADMDNFATIVWIPQIHITTYAHELLLQISLILKSILHFPNYEILGQFFITLKHLPGNYVCLTDKVALALLYDLLQLLFDFGVAIACLCHDKAEHHDILADDY